MALFWVSTVQVAAAPWATCSGSQVVETVTSPCWSANASGRWTSCRPSLERRSIAALVLVLLVVAAVDRDRERDALARARPGSAAAGRRRSRPCRRLPLAVNSSVWPLTLRAVRVVVRTPGMSGASIDGVLRSTRCRPSRRGGGVALGGLVEGEPRIGGGDDVGAARAGLERAGRGAAVRHDDLVDGARHQRGAHLAGRPVGVGGEQQGGVAGDLRRGHRGARDGLVELAGRPGLEHLRGRRVAGQDLDARRDEVGLDPVARRPEGREEGEHVGPLVAPGCRAVKLAVASGWRRTKSTSCRPTGASRWTVGSEVVVGLDVALRTG